MAGLKVYELTTQGTLLTTDWLVIQRGTDPAKKTDLKTLLSALYWTDGVEKISSIASGVLVSGDTTSETGESDNGYIIKNTNANVAARNYFIGANVTAFGDFAVKVGSSNGSDPKAGVFVMEINTSKNVEFFGTVTATGFIPFTGCHIAKSNEDLQLGELVQIKSIGWVNPKQPDWVAEYCNGSKKGVYGVVYDIQIVDIIEDEIKTGEFTQYLIAAVGDGFIEVDCACEYGDWLIPSETKGLATVYKGTGYPRNFVGKAGEDSEGGKISWVKE